MGRKQTLLFSPITSEEINARYPHEVSNVRGNQHYRQAGEGVIPMAWSHQERLPEKRDIGTGWELRLEVQVLSGSQAAVPLSSWAWNDSGIPPLFVSGTKH